MEHTRADALLLAGGLSRRFGSDKRLALFEGEELVRRAARTLLQVSAGTLFVAGGSSGWRLPLVQAAVCVVDQPPGRGPLSGIAAVLPRCRCGVAVIACDLPRLRPSTLAAVVSRGRASGRAAALWGPRGWEPLVSYWPRSVFHDVVAALNQGMLSPQRLLQSLGATAVRAGSPTELVNLNRVGDLSMLEANLGVKQA